LTIDTTGPAVPDDEDLMVEAAVQGLAIAYVTNWVAEAALAEGRLRTVLSAWMHGSEAVAVYYPGHRAVPPALRAFLDVVRDVRQVK
jgi:DNA-binding transcriptional LysR family regulator